MEDSSYYLTSHTLLLPTHVQCMSQSQKYQNTGKYGPEKTPYLRLFLRSIFVEDFLKLNLETQISLMQLWFLFYQGLELAYKSFNL